MVTASKQLTCVHNFDNKVIKTRSKDKYLD